MTTKIKAENIDLSADNLAIGGTSSELFGEFNGAGLGSATTFAINKQSNSHSAVIQLDAGNSAGAYLQLGTTGTKTLQLSSVITADGYDNKLTSIGGLDKLMLGTNGQDRLTIDTSGNVGIGITTPSALLNLVEDNSRSSKTGSAKGQIHISGGLDLSNGDVSGITFSTNTLLQVSSIIGNTITNSGSSLFFGTSNSYVSGVTNTALLIDPTGRVGIGTTNPSSNLHVETNTHANIRIQAGTNSSASLRLRNDAVDWDVNCQTNDNFAIYNHTVGSERLVIDSSGNVTKPGHPVFDVTSSASALTGPISYNTVYVNVGSHYNTSNGRFTAPVAGTYMFTTMYIKNATSGVCRRRFILNGASSGMMNGRQLRMDSGQSYGDNGTMIIIVTLAAGDYVQVDQYVGASHGGHAYEQFSGFLIG